jgi:hypothetical protein
MEDLGIILVSRKWYVVSRFQPLIHIQLSVSGPRSSVSLLRSGSAATARLPSHYPGRKQLKWEQQLAHLSGSGELTFSLERSDLKSSK